MFNINEKQIGKFWVENHEKECFHGNINFNTKDFILELIDPNFNSPKDEKVLINGIIDNKPISFILINHPPINHPPNFQSYNIYDVCMGMHFDTKEDIKFEKIKFKINNISSVINLHSLEYNSSDMLPLKREPFEEVPPILMKDFTVK